ncbi:MAG: ATP-binding protein [Candidatus Omnitrophota bacterium]
MKRNKIEHLVVRKIGMAINRYKMIEAGDRVLVAVSGGKDSLVLLKELQERKKRLPIDYMIKAVHIRTDYDQDQEKKSAKLKRFFKSIGCDYLFRDIAISKTNKLERQDCFWCSWMRRKMLFETADEIGYNKIAFGHHKDDIVETILMNMFWKGEISSMNPEQKLFGGKIVIIRPLVLLEEKQIESYVKHKRIRAVRSCCPRNSDSKRALVKDLIIRLEKEAQDVKTNILYAPSRIRHEYLTMSKTKNRK